MLKAKLKHWQNLQIELNHKVEYKVIRYESDNPDNFLLKDERWEVCISENLSILVERGFLLQHFEINVDDEHI